MPRPLRRPSWILALALMTTGCAAPTVTQGAIAPGSPAPSPSAAPADAVAPAEALDRASRGLPVGDVVFDKAAASAESGPFSVTGSTITLAGAAHDAVAQPDGDDLLLWIDGKTYRVPGIMVAPAAPAGYRTQAVEPVRVVGNAANNRMISTVELYREQVAWKTEEVNRLQARYDESAHKASWHRMKEEQARKEIGFFTWTWKTIELLHHQDSANKHERERDDRKKWLDGLKAELAKLKAGLDMAEREARAIEAAGGKGDLEMLRHADERDLQNRLRDAEIDVMMAERTAGLSRSSYESQRDMDQRFFAKRFPDPSTPEAQADKQRSNERLSSLKRQADEDDKAAQDARGRRDFYAKYLAKYRDLKGRGILQVTDNSGFLGGVRRSIEMDGGDGVDLMVAAPGALLAGERLLGGAGNDVLRTEGGGGRLEGGDGDDTLAGSDGDDVLDGGAGQDTLEGGEGSNQLLGGAGDDRLFGGDDSDWIDAGDGNDRILAGAGDDVVVAGLGDDLAYGGDDNDVLEGDDGRDRLDGGNDDDRLEGGTGVDAVAGDEGEDQLAGGDGDDALDGGTGLDVVKGEAGADAFYVDDASEAPDRAIGPDVEAVQQPAGSLADASLAPDAREANAWFKQKDADESALELEEEAALTPKG